jgi:hypothetical protein
LNDLARRHCFETKNGDYLGEKFVHLAARAVLHLALLAVVFVAEEVVAKQRVVDKTLKDHIKKAGLTKIQQSSATCMIRKWSEKVRK